MSNAKAKPIPFSGDEAFISFLDDMASAVSGSRSGYLRQAAKEFARQRFPQVYVKHFGGEADQQGTVVQLHPRETILPMTELPPMMQGPPKVAEHEPDFLSQVKPRPQPLAKYGAPDSCPSCQVPRYEYSGVTTTKTNVMCSTNPERGRWVCNECTASGQYFPDRPATIE